MAAIGQFERALIGDRSRSGLERARALGKPLGRPRAQVCRDQVLALRAKGLSYRAVARDLHISPALAHRLTRDTSSRGPRRRSETSLAGSETDPKPGMTPEVFPGDCAVVRETGGSYDAGNMQLLWEALSQPTSGPGSLESLPRLQAFA